MVSMDMGSVRAMPHSSSDPFPTSSTITWLEHKQVSDLEVSVHKTAPLPVQQSEHLIEE